MVRYGGVGFALMGVYFYMMIRYGIRGILDFRYLTSEKEDVGNSNIKLKQVVLAEILSKLSRHINRQGLLTIE